MNINREEQGSDFADLFREYQQVSDNAQERLESRAREKERERLKNEREAREAERLRKEQESLVERQQAQARESGPLSSRSGQVVVERWYLYKDFSPPGCTCKDVNNWPSDIRKVEVSREEYLRYQRAEAARAARIEANPGNCCK